MVKNKKETLNYAAINFVPLMSISPAPGSISFCTFLRPAEGASCLSWESIHFLAPIYL